MRLPMHTEIRYIASLVKDASEIPGRNGADYENDIEVRETDGLCGKNWSELAEFGRWNWKAYL